MCHIQCSLRKSNRDNLWGTHYWKEHSVCMERPVFQTEDHETMIPTYSSAVIAPQSLLTHDKARQMSIARIKFAARRSI